MGWDPLRYLSFSDERGRPFVELVGRIDADAPTTVVDLGSGPGHLTGLLAERWPHAHVIGIDSSPTMVDFAARNTPNIEFVLADLHTWQPAEPVDVLISKATLQWVPDHLALLDRLARSISAGGWLAFQVPGNFAEPSHTIRADLAKQDPYAEHLRHAAQPHAHDAATYLRRLTELGCSVDAWETTYFHTLRGPNPVFEWIASTSARPALDALPEDLRAWFAAELKERLKVAYPQVNGMVVLPFRRTFVVARIPSWD
jgi:trans-aconitate 2-methyltransferase